MQIVRIWDYQRCNPLGPHDLQAFLRHCQSPRRNKLSFHRRFLIRPFYRQEWNSMRLPGLCFYWDRILFVRSLQNHLIQWSSPFLFQPWVDFRRHWTESNPSELCSDPPLALALRHLGLEWPSRWSSVSLVAQQNHQQNTVLRHTNVHTTVTQINGFE